MNNCFYKRKKTIFLCLVLFVFSISSCVSHLKEAKLYYVNGEKLSRAYKTGKALASFKRALKEAELAVAKHPSAQAFMLKGMAELNLELWEKAEESFIAAFSFGFEKGQEWAEQVSLFGLASSLQELGLVDSAFKIYTYLLNKSRFKSITVLAAQRYTHIALKETLQEEGKERQKLLNKLLKTAEKLADKDLSCGYYHYLLSQVLSHLLEYKKSFEEAIIAKELGLPKEEIFRDNDLQIVFCYQKLKEKLSSEKWEEFLSVYLLWVKKWNWPNSETPDWKKR